MRPHGSCVPKQSRRPDHEVADIFRAQGEAYRATHPLGPDQRKAMGCIEACRTALLGGHIDVCDDCGTEFNPAYNSCRNRNCPKCQALDQDRWIEHRRQRLLPIGCFHIVFTLPSALRPVALRNRKAIFDTLFTAACQTLLELGNDPKRLGALLGITAVLHTWTRDLRFHPHLHCVVTAGGLAPGASRWIDARRKFLFPVGVMGMLFRGKFVAALQRLHRHGQLDLGDAPDPDRALSELRAKLFSNEWVVYAKRPFAGSQQVFSYLGRYTHRVAISNHRILAVTDDAVTIATRNGNTATMKPQQFIHRFLQHVLPGGFMKIRHYGLWASGNVQTKLADARRLLEQHETRLDERPPPPSSEWREWLKQLTGIDLANCPRCGSKRIHRKPSPGQRPPRPQRPREPP